MFTNCICTAHSDLLCFFKFYPLTSQLLEISKEHLNHNVALVSGFSIIVSSKSHFWNGAGKSFLCSVKQIPLKYHIYDYEIEGSTVMMEWCIQEWMSWKWRMPECFLPCDYVIWQNHVNFFPKTFHQTQCSALASVHCCKLPIKITKPPKACHNSTFSTQSITTK